MKHQTIVIPFVSCPSEIPMVEINFRSGKCIAAVDSGSEQTVFDQGFADMHKDDFVSVKTEKTICLKGIAVDTATAVTDTTGQIHLRDITGMMHPVPLKGIMADMTGLANSFREQYGEQFEFFALIGSDVLKEWGAVIDLRKNVLKLRIPKKPAQIVA